MKNFILPPSPFRLPLIGTISSNATTTPTSASPGCSPTTPPAAITSAPSGSPASTTPAAAPAISSAAAPLGSSPNDWPTCPTRGAEDLLVGQILRAAGIPLSIEPRLVPFGSMEHRPRPENELITLHACTAAWEASHAETGLDMAIG